MGTWAVMAGGGEVTTDESSVWGGGVLGGGAGRIIGSAIIGRWPTMTGRLLAEGFTRLGALISNDFMLLRSITLEFPFASGGPNQLFQQNFDN